MRADVFLDGILCPSLPILRINTVSREIFFKPFSSDFYIRGLIAGQFPPMSSISCFSRESSPLV